MKSIPTAPLCARPIALACAVISVAGCLALPASAHDTWLASKQKTARAGVELDFDLTSGVRFPALGKGPKAERIGNSGCVQSGTKFDVVPGAVRPTSLAMTARVPANASVTCYVELKPFLLDLKVTKIGEYLDEIDAPASVRQAWAAAPTPKRWLETYSKHAKVIIPSAPGQPASAVATPEPVAAPVGLALEFVPEVDLSTGSLAGKLPIKVLREGQPIEGLSVELVSARNSKGTWQKTDAQGRVEFAAPAPGRWMLRATDLRVTNAAESTWASRFATLVFEITAPAR